MIRRCYSCTLKFHCWPGFELIEEGPEFGPQLGQLERGAACEAAKLPASHLMICNFSSAFAEFTGQKFYVVSEVLSGLHARAGAVTRMCF